MEKFRREVVAYKHYFLEFYESQPADVQEKIEWVLNLIRVERQVPGKYFKHIAGVKGLFEIRIEARGNIYRIFSFFDEGNLIIMGNVFQKKTQKTPHREILRAIKIMESYFYEK